MRDKHSHTRQFNGHCACDTGSPS